jgi:hypothetical protein
MARRIYSRAHSYSIGCHLPASLSVGFILAQLQPSTGEPRASALKDAADPTGTPYLPL